MKTLALGYIVKNGAEWLARTLPAMAETCDGIVAVDALSIDGSGDLLRGYGASVFPRPWTDDYGEARNAVRNHAARLGYNSLLMLDCDEAMFPADIAAVKAAVDSDERVVLGFPRYNLCGVDLQRWRPDLYPDTQWRLLPLDGRCWYNGALHETLIVDGRPANDTGTLSLAHIYHYGYCQDPDKIWLRHENYRRITYLEPPLEVVPEGVVDREAVTRGSELFNKPHPLS